MTTVPQKNSRGLDATAIVHGAGVLVLAAVTLGIYLGVVAPAYRVKAEEAARERQAAQDSQDLKVLEDNTLALERLSHALESRLVDTVELRPVDLLNHQVASVSGLLEAHGLQVTKMDPGDPTATPRFILVPIRIAGQGAFADVVSFLHDLHEQCKDTEVSAFAVHADTNASSDQVVFEFCLGWYSVQGGANREDRDGPAGGSIAGVPENR